jgi:hypothetical protein
MTQLVMARKLSLLNRPSWWTDNVNVFNLNVIIFIIILIGLKVNQPVVWGTITSQQLCVSCSCSIERCWVGQRGCRGFEQCDTAHQRNITTIVNPNPVNMTLTAPAQVRAWFHELQRLHSEDSWSQFVVGGLLCQRAKRTRTTQGGRV